MKWGVLYYVIGSVVGVLFSLFVLGSSVFTTYFLDGKRIESEMTDSIFLSKHMNELKTVTLIDYDGIIMNFTHSASDIFPSLSINGGMSTEAYVSLGVIGANTVLVLLLFWISRNIFRSKK